MSFYDINDKGTIDVIVGEKFKIKASTPVHLDAKLVFSEEEFEKVGERQKHTQKIGVRYPVEYTFKALKPGTYDIEYQHFDLFFGEGPRIPLSVDKYHIVVSPEE
jgi:hypothetical protein